MSKMYKSKAYLYQRYVVERKTVTEIAKEAGCSVMTVQNWLEKYGMLRNPRSWIR